MWPRTNRESKVRLSAGFPIGEKKSLFPCNFPNEPPCSCTSPDACVCWLHSRYVHAPDLSTIALLPFEIIALIPLPCGWHGSNYGKRNRAAVQGCRAALCHLRSTRLRQTAFPCPDFTLVITRLLLGCLEDQVMQRMSIYLGRYLCITFLLKLLSA